MICNFPTPYPDEILYSVCARYSDRKQYKRPQSVSIDLFGHEISAKVSLPNCLGNLVANLPPKLNYTVDRLIDNHTIFPFYEPFLPPERSYLLRKRMEGEEKKSLSILTGIRDWT